MAKNKIQPENTTDIYIMTVVKPNLEAIHADVNQGRAEQKVTQATLADIKALLDEKKKKSTKGPRLYLCKMDEVQDIVESSVNKVVRERLSGLDLRARISDDTHTRIEQHISRMAEHLKRPPLFKLNLNCSAKVLLGVLAALILTGIVCYYSFINSPSYLGNELYQSRLRMGKPNPGLSYHWAHQNVVAGNRKIVKEQIDLSNLQEKDYRNYADTLRQLLSDHTIYINGIQYDKSERIIDYTDSTDVIKSAHFRKDGSVRITDNQTMITPEDARNRKGIRWQRVR